MQSFYRYLMTYRGKLESDEESELADWAFQDHTFPKQSTNYSEISDYLEWNSPFPGALQTFDAIWQKYETEGNQGI